MTAERVVSLHGGPVIAEKRPNENIVEKIERLLEQAKSGEIQGVQMIALLHDGCVQHQCAGAVQYNVVGMLFAAAQECVKALES